VRAHKLLKISAKGSWLSAKDCTWYQGIPKTLGPAERVAFVLHDIFGMLFEEIAIHRRAHPWCGPPAGQPRTPPCPGTENHSDVTVEVQLSVVAAFVAAAHDGDFQRLVAVRDPDVVLRGDAGAQAGGSF
jgi:hypothetical protein